MNEFVKPAEAAEFFGVCRATLLAWAKSGVVPSVRLGRKIYIPRRFLDEVRKTGLPGYGQAVAS